MAVDKSRILKGKVERPPRVVVYGFDGVGKTGFAAGAPNTFFLDANKGSFKYDVSRVIVESWDETYEWLAAVESGEIACENVALDAVSDFERMSHARLFPGTTVSKFEGGFNKGDDVAVMEWTRLLYHLERVWMRGKGIILVAHATVKKFEDPTGPGYERFELATRKPLAHLLRGWADYVLFARESVAIAGEKNKPVKATTTGERWIYTRRTPAFDAKARGTALFPEKIPLSWGEFVSAIREDDARGSQMRRDLDAMLVEIGDKVYEKIVRDWLTQYPLGLVDAFNRVQIRFNEKKAAEDAAATDKAAAAAA
jgi:AAA domain